VQRPQRISPGEAAALLYNVFLSSTFLLPTGLKAGRDSWLAVLLAGGAGLLLAPVIVGLVRRFPGRGMVGYNRLLLGRWIGGLVGLLFVGYSIQFGALVLRNFAEFVAVVVLPATPLVVSMLLIALLASYAVHHGLETLARTGFVVSVVVTLNILVGALLSIGQMRWEQLLPILDEGWGPLFPTAFSVFSYTCGEAVIGCQALASVRPASRVRAGLVGAIALTTGILMLIQIQNLTILGVEVVRASQYPTLEVFKSIDIGDFLSRLDVVAGINWISGGFVKVAVALYAASSGLTECFGLGDYRPLVLPLMAIMTTLALVIVPTYATLVRFATTVWPVYTLPFQVGLPVLLLAIAWITGTRPPQDSQ